MTPPLSPELPTRFPSHLDVAGDLRVVQQTDCAFHLLTQRPDARAPEPDHFHGPSAPSPHALAGSEHAPQSRTGGRRPALPLLRPLLAGRETPKKGTTQRPPRGPAGNSAPRRRRRLPLLLLLGEHPGEGGRKEEEEGAASLASAKAASPPLVLQRAATVKLPGKARGRGTRKLWRWC